MAEPDPRHTRIIVVDDNPVVRSALQQLLHDEGFIVDTAANGSLALAMVREHPPDIVLTDLQMPEMDGIALCRALHELVPNLPVIVVTAASDIATAVSALRAGAEDYLTKPVDLDAMLVSIQRVLEHRIDRIEREHLRARTEALYQQALAAVRARDEVLSIVSHDLRNPLGVIALRAQQLAEHASTCEHGGDELTIAASILRSTQSMARLISDLLDESGIRTGHLRLERDVHSLSQLLADAVELAPLARQKRIHLDIKPLAGDVLLTCDRARLGQALGNLIANAIKFSPADGVITVSAEPADGGVRFVVRDSGPGIAADLLPLIFGRFWRPSGNGQPGVGLGLYIVKSIVEAHGGSASVESRLGAGSSFSFFIPDAGPASPEADSPQRDASLLVA